MSKRLSGFTLIELLVAIAIIGILATIVVVSLESAKAGARYSKDLANMSQIARAVETYKSDTGKFPNEVGAGTRPGKYPDEEAYADFANYLQEMPKAACTDWTYDWDNWSKEQYEPSTSAYQECRDTVRITLRKKTAEFTYPSIYFYCVQYVPKGSDDPTPYCLGGALGASTFRIDPVYPAGGEDIKSVSSKIITCKE